MNWLDLVIIICLITGIIHGLVTGIVKQVITLVAFVAAILLSGAVANLFRQLIQPYINGGNPYILNIIYYIAAFLIIISIFAVLAKLVDKVINYTPIGLINKVLGAIFGIFLWTLFISILLNFISVFDSESKLISQTVKENSIFYDGVKMLFPNIFPYIRNFFNS